MGLAGVEVQRGFPDATEWVSPITPIIEPSLEVPAMPPLDLLGADAMQLGHSINMVAELPDTVDEEFRCTRAALLAKFGLTSPGQAAIFDQDEWSLLYDLCHDTRVHVVTYAPERHDDPPITVDTTVRARLLPLVDQVVAGRDPVDGWLQAVLDRLSG